MFKKNLNRILFIIIMMLPLSSWSESGDSVNTENRFTVDDIDFSFTIENSNSIDGIWKRTGFPFYFSIYQQNGKIVVIDLFRLESSGNSLTSAYIGDIDGELSPMAPFQDHPESDKPIIFNLRTETTAHIETAPSACSGTCVPFVFFLEKVFK